MSVREAFHHRWWPWSKNRNDWTAGLPVVPRDPTAVAAESAQREEAGVRRQLARAQHSKAEEGR